MDVNAYFKYALKLLPKNLHKKWKETQIFIDNCIPQEIRYVYRDEILNDQSTVQGASVIHNKLIIKKCKLALEQRYRVGKFVLVKHRNLKSALYNVHAYEEKEIQQRNLFDEILAEQEKE